MTNDIKAARHLHERRLCDSQHKTYADILYRLTLSFHIIIKPNSLQCHHIYSLSICSWFVDGIQLHDNTSCSQYNSNNQHHLENEQKLPSLLVLVVYHSYFPRHQYGEQTN